MHSDKETYLSDYVHLVLVEYGFCCKTMKTTSKSNFIEVPDILYDWKYIQSSFTKIDACAIYTNKKTVYDSHRISCRAVAPRFAIARYKKRLNSINDLDVCNQCENWYLENIKTVWAAIHSAGSAVNAADSCEREKLYQLAGWVCDPSQLTEFHQLSQMDDCTNILLPILHMTAAFERALRNLYLLKNNPAPFLLRDLLKSEEISHTLRRIPTLFTQLILGCPKGLNLRNVAWHGFLSPGELHSDIIPGLIVLFASIQRLLPTGLVSRKFYVVNTFDNFYKDLNGIFPDLMDRQSEVLNILSSSPYLNQRLLIYWKKAYSLFLHHRFGDCLVLLMPQLEHCLRVIFCQVNNCPTQLLTAESTSLYTTLDEILTPSLNPVVREGLLMMLLDLTVSMSGPRLRDKLSHGECDLASIPGWFANHVIALALSVTHQKVSCEIPLCSEFEAATSFYRSKFHIYTILYQRTESLLTQWIELLCCSKPPSDLPLELDSCSCKNISDLDALLFPNISLMSEKVSMARDTLSKNMPSTLFRPRLELEIATSLMNVVGHMSETFKTIQSTASRFEQQWREKTLRSRSRQTALRMWSVLPDLVSALLTLLTTIAVFYNHLPILTQVKDIKRLMKSMTKAVENTVILCNVERNRWMEAHQLILLLAREIHDFFLLNKHIFNVAYL